MLRGAIFIGARLLAPFLAQPVCADLFPQPVTLGGSLIYAQPVIALETNSEGGRVEFAARTHARPGLEATYGRFNLSVSAISAGSDGNWLTPKIPAPDWNDVRTRYHGDLWGAEAFHQNVRGFDRQSEASHHTAPESRSAMSLQSSGATVYRSIDPDSRVYRLSEGLDQTGANFDVFWTLGMSHLKLRDDTPLLEGLYAPDSKFENVYAVDVTSLALGAGYAISSNMDGLYFDQALFGGYGPQIRTWGGHSEAAWKLVRVNLRARLGVRNRWFDAGVGFENEAHAALAGSERLVLNALSAQVKVDVFL